MEVKFNINPKIQFYQSKLEGLLPNYDSFRQKKASNLCLDLIRPHFEGRQLWLTHSGTAALEIIADLLWKTGKKEIILPSFCFVSTAVVFQNKGFQLRLAEADPNTLSASIDDIHTLVTEQTAAIIWMHYAGTTSPDFDQLISFCSQKEIFLIEDAALGFGRTHRQKALGNFGSAAIFSFDITKPFSAVQGGLLVLNQPSWQKSADTYYHIGTNRTDFEEGLVANYQWVGEGSKCQLNELNAAFLLHDLQHLETKLQQLKRLSSYYIQKINALGPQQTFSLPAVFQNPDNHHVVGLLFASPELAAHVQNCMKNAGIEVFSHYQALHNTPFAKANGLYRPLPFAAQLSTNYMRLPLHEDLTFAQIDYAIDQLQLALQSNSI